MESGLCVVIFFETREHKKQKKGSKQEKPRPFSFVSIFFSHFFLLISSLLSSFLQTQRRRPGAVLPEDLLKSKTRLLCHALGGCAEGRVAGGRRPPPSGFVVDDDGSGDDKQRQRRRPAAAAAAALQSLLPSALLAPPVCLPAPGPPLPRRRSGGHARDVLAVGQGEPEADAPRLRPRSGNHPPQPEGAECFPCPPARRRRRCVLRDRRGLDHRVRDEQRVRR